jgi:NAD(P)-dependent dehydrogenase (short-subunit alcohol dehydrogenase family)
MKEAIPHLRKQRGRIISVSSGAAYHPIYAGSAYCASKAALNQLNSVAAKEEPGVTCVAVRPGVVDTAMQEKIRREGPAVMPSEEAGYYLSLKTENNLEPPEIPGRSIAWLALAAPNSFSGRFMSYDDSEIALPAKAFFGEILE